MITRCCKSPSTWAPRPWGALIVPNGNTFSWTSQTILSDDDGAHKHSEAEIVTILSGQSVEMRQPRSVLHLIGANWVEEPTQCPRAR